MVLGLFQRFETSFRGKTRGRFALTREQLKIVLDVKRLDQSIITRLQDAMLVRGLVMIDLDDVFPFIEESIIRRYRRPSYRILNPMFPRIPFDGLKETDDEDEG